MTLTLADFWRPSGTTDRGTYALVGFVGFALKHNLDRLVATLVFHRPWTLFNYWLPLQDVRRITDLHSADGRFLEGMLALALPFIWGGVIFTLRRLRSAQFPAWLLFLFFVPFLNLLFFLVLCLAPEKGASNTLQSKPESRLRRFLPQSALGGAAASLLITVPPGFGLFWVGLEVSKVYGWGVFVAIPFTMGFGAALIYGLRKPHGLGGQVGVAVLSVAILGVLLLGVAMEGAVCLMMAIPIAVPLAAFGGACAHFVQKRRWSRDATPVLAGMLFVLTPGVQAIEHFIARPAETFVVRSSIDIKASPEEVWRQVVAFSQIPPPTEWLFRAGIAYPIRAEMIGSGPGAERHCVFSTGAFVEPIKIWEEPRLLKFSVTSNPAPMEEWTPYGHIDTPHLHGFLISNGGQFLLTPLPNGGTRLEGTTWYQHGLWPAAYWQLWSDRIIHQIHMRVLRHIRDEVEKKSA